MTDQKLNMWHMGIFMSLSKNNPLQKIRWILLEFFINHDSVSTIPGKEEQIRRKILYCY